LLKPFDSIADISSICFTLFIVIMTRGIMNIHLHCAIHVPTLA
jgi:hypothetical protein